MEYGRNASGLYVGNTLWLKPVKFDKKGPAFSVDEVQTSVMRMVNAGQFFSRGCWIKRMESDSERATKMLDEATKSFSDALNRNLAVQESLAEGAKSASTKVRVAMDQMAASVAKIEKTANFDRLERYVTLLERAASAMKTLADLEAEGRLGKITEALK